MTKRVLSSCYEISKNCPVVACTALTALPTLGLGHCRPQFLLPHLPPATLCMSFPPQDVLSCRLKSPALHSALYCPLDHITLEDVGTVSACLPWGRGKLCESNYSVFLIHLLSLGHVQGLTQNTLSKVLLNK